jgi:amino acid transporter
MLTRMVRKVLGPARDPMDSKVYHQISLIAFLAWVGIGADGLSSSCYGPEEAFKALGDHRSLAFFVALATAATITVLSAGYAYVIETFPSGGGGYAVTSKLLGPGLGVLAGSALLVDYVLTITVSITSGVDALFSLRCIQESIGALVGPLDDESFKQTFKLVKIVVTGLAILGLTTLNLRGVKESVLTLLPIFIVFLVTHLVAIGAGFLGHTQGLPSVVKSAWTDASQSMSTLGFVATAMLFIKSYALGAGTYTGIEAVSNSMQVLREPKVATGRRTMLYMAISLSVVSGGILLGYLLLDVQPEKGKTLNAILLERIAAGWGGVGNGFVLVALLSETALLFVGAQAGFIGGPRMLATMAVDRWMPQRFMRLSDRLVTQDGVILISLGAIGFLLVTQGDIGSLVVLYSLNVFVTFTLTQLGMVRHWWRTRSAHRGWRLAVSGVAFLLCLVILVVMLRIKFTEGAWITVVVTTALCLVAWTIRRHYRGVARTLGDLDRLVDVDPTGGKPASAVAPVDPTAPTAVLLVSGFNGIGIHSILAILRHFPGHFKNWAFVMVGVVDYDRFKGTDEIENLKRSVHDDLSKYAAYMHRLGFPAETYATFGIDPIHELESICPDIARQHPRAVFFGGQLVFARENFFTQSLHSGAVFEIQRRLHFQGLPMVVLPVRVLQQPPAGVAVPG